MPIDDFDSDARRTRTRPIDEQPHCPQCGYNLAGAGGDGLIRCPECGHETSRREARLGPPPTGLGRLRERIRDARPMLRRFVLTALFLSPAAAFTAGEIWSDAQDRFRAAVTYGGLPALYLWACALLWLRGAKWWGLFAVAPMLIAIPANAALAFVGAAAAFLARWLGWMIIWPSLAVVGLAVAWYVSNYLISDAALDDYTAE